MVYFWILALFIAKMLLNQGNLMVRKKRPVNLELSTLHFPVMAIVSILHRLSGILIFLLLPFMLYLLDRSLFSLQSFGRLKLALANPWFKLPFWAFLSAFLYHVLAGIRHLMMDLGRCESLACARKSAFLILAVSTGLIVFLGVVLW